MAKRFTDSRKWDDDWFVGLSAKHKLFWLYVCDKCDHVGLYKPALKIASFLLESEYTEEELLKVFEGRIVKLSCGKWFVPKFISFQYGRLREDGRLHRTVIDKLKESLTEELFNRYVWDLIGCDNSDDTLKDKNMDKDMEQEEEKKEKKEEKKEYSQYVRLTEYEYNSLIVDYGLKTVKHYIESLTEYIGQNPASHGRKYKNHFFTIKSWMRRDSVKMLPPPPKPLQPRPEEPMADPAEVHKMVKSLTSKLGGKNAN